MFWIFLKHEQFPRSLSHTCPLGLFSCFLWIFKKFLNYEIYLLIFVDILTVIEGRLEFFIVGRNIILFSLIFGLLVNFVQRWVKWSIHGTYCQWVMISYLYPGFFEAHYHWVMAQEVFGQVERFPLWVSVSKLWSVVCQDIVEIIFVAVSFLIAKSHFIAEFENFVLFL